MSDLTDEESRRWAMTKFPHISYEKRLATFASVENLGLDASSTIRFCVAREFDEKKVKKMIKAHLEWRRDIGFNLMQLKDCPILLESRFLSASNSRDKEGRVIALFDIEHFDRNWDLVEVNIWK